MRIPTVERKIYFYRADIGRDAGGRPLPFDPTPMLNTLEGLPFLIGSNGRYEEEPDGNVLCGIPSTGNPMNLRFCRIRRVGLPQLERQGEIRELDIDPDTGLLEATHVAFLGDNIVGIEYNHFGPRASWLGNYLHKKARNDAGAVAFHPLLRSEIARQLEELTEIRLFEFRVRPGYISVVRQASKSLADALEANYGVIGDQESIQIVLRSSKSGRRPALQKLSAAIRYLLRRRDLNENAQQFKVRGYRNDTGRVETIDLLSSYIVVTKAIRRISPRSRALNADSVFREIHEAYDQVRDEIDLATAIEYD